MIEGNCTDDSHWFASPLGFFRNGVWWLLKISRKTDCVRLSLDSTSKGSRCGGWIRDERMAIILGFEAYNGHLCKIHPVWIDETLVSFCKAQIVFSCSDRCNAHPISDEKKDVLGLVFIHFGIIFDNWTAGITHLNILAIGRFFGQLCILNGFIIKVQSPPITTSCKKHGRCQQTNSDFT